MKRSGRASIVVVGGVVGIIIILLVALTSGESASTVANRFMVALSKGDAATLADVSVMGDRSPEDVKKAWEETLNASQHFRFKYRVILVETPGPDSANAKIGMERNYAPNGSSYEENYQLPLHKQNGKWKVDVSGMPRGMYLWLPR